MARRGDGAAAARAAEHEAGKQDVVSRKQRGHGEGARGNQLLSDHTGSHQQSHIQSR